MKQKSLGFTLIEFLVVMSIAAVLLMVAMPFLRGVFVESRIPRVVEDMALISHRFRAQAAMALHQTAVPYTDLGSPTAAVANAANIGRGRVRGMVVVGAGATATLTHEIGAPSALVRVQQAQIVQMGDAFEFTLEQVHRRACPALAQQMDRRVVITSINGVVVKALGGSLNMGASELACTDENTNTFTFTFQ